MTNKATGLGSLPQANIFDNVPDFTRVVHVRENKPENEKHLNANRRKLTGDCAIVLSLLQKGFVLTTLSAHVQWQVSSLPRRIKDLRDEGGIDYIQDKFVKNDSEKGTSHKIWFIKEMLSDETKRKYGIE